MHYMMFSVDMSRSSTAKVLCDRHSGSVFAAGPVFAEEPASLRNSPSNVGRVLGLPASTMAHQGQYSDEDEKT